MHSIVSYLNNNDDGKPGKGDVQYDEKEENDEDDDIEEVFVSGGDKRLEIFNTKHKNDIIVQCIGHLRIRFAGVGGGYCVGTGTIFHVEGNKCFVLTCAHNIRMKLWHCTNEKCKGKMLRKTACNRCGSSVIKKQDIYKAVGVTFVRWGVTKETFGNHEGEFDCDMDECLINDKEYYKYPHIKAGNDIAVLVINDKQAAHHYMDRCKQIFLTNNFNLFSHDKRQITLFGYPGDKNAGKQMWGMSTTKINQLFCGFNVESAKFYLINDEIDTAYGQSGSSLYCLGDIEDTIWICSIHTGGSKKKAQNYGTLLDTDTIEWMKQCFDDINIDITPKIIHKKTKLSTIYEQVVKLNCLAEYRQLTDMGFVETIVLEALHKYGSDINECVNYITSKNEQDKINENTNSTISVLQMGDKDLYEHKHAPNLLNKINIYMNTNDKEQLQQHTDNLYATNKHISGSKLMNRTCIVREQYPSKSTLGYFMHNNEGELEYQGKIDITDINNNHFSPTKVLQYKSGCDMLLLNSNGSNPGNIQVLNLEKGKVIEEWQTKDTLNDITPLCKHDDMTDTPMLYGINNKSAFMIDPRIPSKSKVIGSKQKTYRMMDNNNGLNVISTSGNGFIAIGAKNGTIRMQNTIERKAPTVFRGLGNTIKHIEISDDGYWILATCPDYIMVISTQVPGTNRTGFEGRGMGKLKPSPYVLRLQSKDVQKYKLHKDNFTAAHFDQGKNINEHWIICSTGSYIITWNFDELKESGNFNSYSIRKAKSAIIQTEFRFNYRNEVVVMETNSVYTHCNSQK